MIKKPRYIVSPGANPIRIKVGLNEGVVDPHPVKEWQAEQVKPELSLFEQFAAFLRERQPIRKIEYLEPGGWDSMNNDPKPYKTSMEIIEFEELLRAMDDFGAELRERQKEKTK